jgi:Na+-translocating ferredoxin:NAD+ oxidoreductase RNF subunit RnfB
MLTTLTISLASGVMAALAVAMAWVLGWAKHAFHVEVNPTVEAIVDVLPGANCGGCGYVGCREYAETIARGDCDVTLCGPGGAACAERLAEIMGVDIDGAIQVWAYAGRGMRKPGLWQRRQGGLRDRMPRLRSLRAQERLDHNERKSTGHQLRRI